jgi:hypothetical protein
VGHQFIKRGLPLRDETSVILSSHFHYRTSVRRSVVSKYLL